MSQAVEKTWVKWALRRSNKSPLQNILTRISLQLCAKPLGHLLADEEMNQVSGGRTEYRNVSHSKPVHRFTRIPIRRFSVLLVGSFKNDS